MLRTLAPIRRLRRQCGAQPASAPPPLGRTALAHLVSSPSPAPPSSDDARHRAPRRHRARARRTDRRCRARRRMSTIPQGARRIDGRGKCVIPGLADMHAHLYADEWVARFRCAVRAGRVCSPTASTTARLMIGTADPSSSAAESSRPDTRPAALDRESAVRRARRSANTTWSLTADDARRAVREVADCRLRLREADDGYHPGGVRRRRGRGGAPGDPRGRPRRPAGRRRAGAAARQQIEHLDNYMESVLADCAAIARERVRRRRVPARQTGRPSTCGRPQGRAIAGATARARRVRHAHAGVLPISGSRRSRATRPSAHAPITRTSRARCATSTSGRGRVLEEPAFGERRAPGTSRCGIGW